MANPKRNKKAVSPALASYGCQNIDGSDESAVLLALRSDRLTQGPRVEEFEKKLASYCGARHAVAVNSGTAALHIAYLAAGIGRGDEVITTPNTFVATSNMALAVGAKPVFCDIRLDTFNINEKSLEALITKKTKAIVPVDFAGRPCDMDAIMKTASRHGLTVIEDACHSLGASYGGRKVGSLAHMTAFSFHPVKHITTGEGGAVLTDDDGLYEKLKRFRSHGIVKDKDGFNSMIDLGFNYRLPDLNAALGTSQLGRLDLFVKKRRMLVEVYLKHLKGLEEIILPAGPVPSSSWHLFVIRLVDPGQRATLAAHLKTAGIASMIHYPAVYSHPYYRQHGYEGLFLPNEEAYQSSCLTLPLHPQMTASDASYASSVIREFFEND